MSVLHEVEGTPIALADRPLVDRQLSLPARTPDVRPLRWATAYTASVAGIDLVAAETAALIAFFVRWGGDAPVMGLAVALLLPAAWLVLMVGMRLYEPRFLGVGSEEFRRVGRAGLVLFAFCGVLAYVTATPVARGFILVAVPLTVGFDLLGRYGLRKTLHAQRRKGNAMHKVLLVGSRAGVRGMVRELAATDSMHGMQVVGVCCVDRGRTDVEDLPLELGGLGDIRQAVDDIGADMVAVLSSPETSGPTLRQIAWSLEGSPAELVVAPGLVEVAGPRLTIRPVAGLSLLHLDRPEFTGGRRWLKAGFDRSIAALAIVALSPLFAALLIAIRLDGCGSSIYRQVRVGVGGRQFTLFKFRSMCADADRRRIELETQNDRAEGPLFKMREDPRVTPIGRVLRRYSLDEFPQLVNVVRGEMSLVGPRPPLPEEVAQYGDDVHRRLLVKPGLTGLWQVSGRSDLTWEESVRLDLRYVDNWSLALDLLILWKTLRVVVRASGAY